MNTLTLMIMEREREKERERERERERESERKRANSVLSTRQFVNKDNILSLLIKPRPIIA